MTIYRTILATCALLAVATPTFAQLPGRLSDEARITLITVFPGDPVYTMFGHSAIRVVDPATGFDASFNYGTFDFDRSFPLRFASGRLDYRLDVNSTSAALRQYEIENRTVVEQRLDLEPDVIDMVYRFLVENYRPENRYYRYDFLRDNCSTRVRDVLEIAVGRFLGQPSASRSAVIPPGAQAATRGYETYRDLLERYTNARPLLGAFIHTALGPEADQIVLDRERAFLPVELMFQTEATTVDGRPLVTATDTLYYANGLPRSRHGIAVFLAWLVVSGCAGVSVYRWKRMRPRSRVVDPVLFGAVGIAGLLITYLWFGSEHEVASPNTNLIWAWPTHLLAAAFMTKKHLPTWMLRYLALSAAGVVVLLGGLFWWSQEIPTLVVPIAVLLAFRAGRCFFPRRQVVPPEV